MLLMKAKSKQSLVNQYNSVNAYGSSPHGSAIGSAASSLNMLIPDSRTLNLAEEDFKNISENKDESIRTCYLDEIRTKRNRSKTDTPKTSQRDRLLIAEDGYETPSPKQRLHDRLKEA